MTLLQDLVNNDSPPAREKEPAPAEERPVRQRTRKKAPAKPGYYDDMALFGAEAGAFLFWGALWVVDGYFTVIFLKTLFSGLPWYAGAALHLIVSFVQHHLWRKGWKDHWLPIIAVSTFNIATSVVGLLAQVAVWTTARAFQLGDITTLTVPLSMTLMLLCIWAGIAIAILPERKAASSGRNIFHQTASLLN